jgi:purine-binding chemotaxis protein CheW
MKKKTQSRRAGPIDWQKIHRQLDQLRSAVEREWTPDPAAAQQILKQRAATLAAPAQAPDRGPTLEIVEFCLGGEYYAVDATYVREVFPLTELTYIPCTPVFVLGVVNVRGEIVSVIELKKLFGLPERGLTDLNKVVILHTDALTFGILADRIVGVRDLPVAEIQAPLASMAGAREDFLLGIAGDMVVLDAQKLLSDPKIIVNDVVAP